MQRTQYTPEQKAEALQILAELGQSEASRRTGIPGGTIASWGHRGGVSAPDAPKMAQQVQASWSIRKVALGEKLGSLCEKMATKIDERLDEDSLRGVRDLAASIAILVDRAQLLTGGLTGSLGVTARSEPEAAAERDRALTTINQLADRRNTAA